MWVSNKLNLPPATLIINVSPEGTPLHAITGINGFGFIAVSRSTLPDKSLLVHEITHCTLMSRAIFLDEGLATLLQYEANDLEVPSALFYWDRPSIAALIEIDWSDDPYFAKIVPGVSNATGPLDNDGRAHNLGAYIIKTMIEKKSLKEVIQALPKLKTSLREGKSAAVFKEIFSLDLWAIDKKIIQDSSIEILPPSEDSLLQIAPRVMAEEDRDLAALWLPYARLMAYEDTDSLVAMIKLLILLGNTRENPNEGAWYRIEALAAMHWAETKNLNEITKDFFEGYKHVFKLRNAGHAIELRTVGVLASKAFEELLVKYPDNPEVIIATAKAQIKTDHEILPMEDWKKKLAEVSMNPVYENAVKLLLEHERFA